MWTRHWTAADAISFVQKRRHCVHPNYGFVRQLQAFQACGYNPSPTNGAYLAWKRRSKRDVSCYLNLLNDTIHVHPYKLYVSSEFPKNSEKGDLFLADMEVSHFLTVSPSQTTSISLGSVRHLHINISNSSQEALLLALPEACEFIRNALTRHGLVLVHCRAEMRACIIVAAFVMTLREVTPRGASSILEEALPLFQPTPILPIISNSSQLATTDPRSITRLCKTGYPLLTLVSAQSQPMPAASSQEQKAHGAAGGKVPILLAGRST